MRSPLVSIAVAAGLLIGLSAVAVAAPKKKLPPPPPPPAWSWTGYYAGVNLGYSWGSSNFNETFLNSITSFPVFVASGNINNIDGVIGGGQIGYNWQYGNWIVGLEADFQGSGERGSGTFTCPAGVCSILTVTTTVNERLDWFGTVRPRLGWTVTPTTMIYATGGLAYGEVNDSGTITNGVIATAFDISRTSAGWTAGGGIEGQLSGNWTWKLEYLFLALEEPSGFVTTSISACPIVGANCPGGTLNGKIDPLFEDNIIRAGINYKWP